MVTSVRSRSLRYVTSLIAAMALCDFAVAQQPDFEVLAEELTPELAGRFFEEARVLSQRDAGRLWGVSLYGPMLIVDPKTRTIVANQADREGNLTSNAGVFVGTLPTERMIASTAMDFGGVRWTMLAWPLPKDRIERARLMAHELWHRVQDGLGLMGSGPGNPHLDTRDGRTWMQLEWRALRAALQHSGIERERAISDALTFRAYRRSLFPAATAGERGLETGEGLAEYTGVRLAGESDSTALTLALENLQNGEKWPTFVRSFAYASGPAYGLLLDEAKPAWRTGLKGSDDMGELLRAAMVVEVPMAWRLQREAQSRIARYNGDRLIAAETERDNARQKRLALYRKRFVDDPVLTIPLRRIEIGFSPLTLEPLDDLGTVYPTARISDVWGVLNVTAGGVLMDSGWTKITVPAPEHPDARPLKGDGWTLELKGGWELSAEKRKGDFGLRRADDP